MNPRLLNSGVNESRNVFLVDDDLDIREALSALLTSVGYKVTAFASVETLMTDGNLSEAGCLVLDVRLTGQSGIAFQAQLVRENSKVPIVFISGHGDIPMAVRAIQSGAVEFLTKPIRSQDLIDAIQLGLERDSERRAAEATSLSITKRLNSLTPREQDVLNQIVVGKANKQIAHILGISEPTVKAHRGQVMRKMDVKSLPELVRLVAELVRD
jgi:FixJ family two-component response regulator